MNFKDDLFLQSLIARLDQPGVIGIALVGSYARGDNKQYQYFTKGENKVEVE